MSAAQQPQKWVDGYYLSNEDKLLFSTLALKATFMLSAQYFQFQRKVLTEDDWHENRVVAIYWAISPGYQQWWDAIGNAAFAGEFKQFMEFEIEQAKQPPTSI